MGNLTALSPDDFDLLFEPNPYSYDSTVTDPSLPPSPFVQAMREQEELFFAAFPEAKKAAEYRELRKAQLRAFLASTDENFPPTRVPTPYGLPQDPTPLYHTHENHFFNNVQEVVPAIPAVYSHTRDNPLDSPHLLRIDQEQVKSEPEDTYLPIPQPQPPHTPTLHDRHASDDSGSQHIDTHKPTRTISRDRGDRTDQPSKPAPKRSSSCNARPRLNKNKNKSSPKPRVPGKRQQQPVDPRKPTLACLFCRGRKIACGAPLPGSIGKTCNQCQRRCLPCEFPVESRRGMRKRKGDEVLGESILSP